MANTFKNKVTVNIGTIITTVYTAPALTTSTVIGLSVANIANAYTNVDVVIVDSSANITGYLVRSVPVPVGGTLVVIGGDQKVILEPGDYLRVFSSNPNSLDCVVSVLEITA